MPHASRLVIAAGLTAGLAALTSAQGCQFRGPGDLVPPDPNAALPGVAGAPGPRVAEPGVDLTRWVFWWELNKERFLYPTAPGLRAPLDAETTARLADALLAANAAPSEPRIVAACLVALAKIARHDVPTRTKLQPILRASLRSKHQQTREVAALALGIGAFQALLGDLTALAHDSAAGRALVDRAEVDGRTRTFAGHALGLLAAAVPDDLTKAKVHAALAKLLDDPTLEDKNVLCGAIAGLRVLSPDFAGGDARLKKVRDDAVETLLRFYSRPLAQSLRLPQAHVPPAVARLLGRGDTDLHRRCKELFGAALNVKNEPKRPQEVCQSSALALGLMCGPDDAAAIDALSLYTKEGRDLMTRDFAMIALGEIGGTRCRALLLELLDKGNQSVVKPWAALALGVLCNRIRAAGGPGDREVGAKLRQVLANAAHPDARQALAIGLGLAGDAESAAAIRAILAGARGNEDLAGYTATALALLADTASVEPVRELALRSLRRPDLTRHALVALASSGDAKLEQLLAAVLSGREARSDAVLAATALAYGKARLTAAVPALLEILRDQERDVAVRACAAAALGCVADREPRPWNAAFANGNNYRAAVATMLCNGAGILELF